MPTQPPRRYFVRITKLSEHPIVEPEALLTQNVSFAIRQDGDRAEVPLDMPYHWSAESKPNWQEDVVAAAMDRSASESA